MSEASVDALEARGIRIVKTREVHARGDRRAFAGDTRHVDVLRLGVREETLPCSASAVDVAAQLVERLAQIVVAGHRVDVHGHERGALIENLTEDAVDADHANVAFGHKELLERIHRSKGRYV